MSTPIAELNFDRHSDITPTSPHAAGDFFLGFQNTGDSR
jgi:hypothetical protein